MTRRPFTAFTLSALLLGGATAATAAIQSGWPLLAFAKQNGCNLEITGNGRFTEIRASGLIPGEALRFTLTNGDMQPIDWQVYATRSGTWRKLYLPFRFNRDGGTVSAHLSASRCSLSASVPWTRQVRTID